MDLGNLAQYGRSRSTTGWATNPLRRVVWWLIAPYFRGAATRIDAAINAKFDALVAANALDASVGAGSSASAAEFGKTWQERLSATVASQMGGLRKDSYAIAQRLAGIEEERGTLTERMSSLMREFYSTTDGFDRRHGQLEQAIRDVQAQVASHPDDKGLVVAKSPSGDRLLVRQHDHIGRRIIDGEEWEPHVRKAIEAAADPDGIAVDAGAYIGIHTMTMSRCFSAVHAFEPQKGIFQVLCGNLALNERLNVTTHNVALYDRSSAMRLAPQDHQEVEVPIRDGQPRYERLKNAAALSFEIAASGEEQIDAIALDALELDNVRMIKIDTQGSDFHVLKGAKQTILRCRPIVIFEWEQELAALHNSTMKDLHEFFDNIDYEVEILHETTPKRQLDYIAKPRLGA
ncbi:FkbM family methyltransferase [Methylobacterium bullatum]|uniref:Methyltransferase FkbM domain-containing protein n=1 Tax=Methylobacterium bullatum TaxID=570505 RepID=A0A679KCF2_9HYPH|nr:hypothetical protein MBLL_03956 [Methylobacterium bullatum]